MPAEHAEDHGAEADSCELRGGVLLELACENGVHSHDHEAEDVGHDRGAGQSSEMLQHVTTREPWRCLGLEHVEALVVEQGVTRLIFVPILERGQQAFLVLVFHLNNRGLLQEEIGWSLSHLNRR